MFTVIITFSTIRESLGRVKFVILYVTLLISVRVISVNLNTLNSHFQVKNIYITCNYLGFSGNYIWDIAILELVEPFELSATLVPVCLDPFTYNDQTVLEAGSYGKVAGFGRTETGESSGILQSLTVPFIPFNQCRSASQIAQTEQYITIDKFCAGYTNG